MRANCSLRRRVVLSRLPIQLDWVQAYFYTLCTSFHSVALNFSLIRLSYFIPVVLFASNSSALMYRVQDHANQSGRLPCHTTPALLPRRVISSFRTSISCLLTFAHIYFYLLLSPFFSLRPLSYLILCVHLPPRFPLHRPFLAAVVGGIVPLDNTERTLSRNLFVQGPRGESEGSHLINYTNVEALTQPNALLLYPLADNLTQKLEYPLCCPCLAMTSGRYI